MKKKLINKNTGQAIRATLKDVENGDSITYEYEIQQLIDKLEGFTDGNFPDYDPDNELDVTSEEIHKDILEALHEAKTLVAEK